MENIYEVEGENLAPFVVVKKHSAIIQMKNGITANQRKMFNAILYLAGKQLLGEPDRMDFKVRFSEIRKYSGLSHFTDFKYLKNALNELKNINIEYNILEKDKEIEWGAFSLLSEVKITKKDEYVHFAFPPSIHKNIGRPSIYALLNLGIISGLKSKYAIALYEMLQDYKKIKKIRLEIDVLRKLMGIEEKQYKIFTMFRQKVLDVAVDEINNKSDLRVSYELEQDGRKYSAIHLKFEKLSVNPDEIHKIGNMLNINNAISDDERQKHEIILKLIYYGISDKKAEEFYTNLSEDELLSGIKILENALKSKDIKNPGGYLSVLLNNGTSLMSLFDKDKEIKAQVEIIPVISIEEQKRYDELKHDFDLYYEKKTLEIMAEIEDIDIEEFLASHNNSFFITYFQNCLILNSAAELIDRAALISLPLFIDYVLNNKFPYDSEFKKYREEAKF